MTHTPTGRPATRNISPKWRPRPATPSPRPRGCTATSGKRIPTWSDTVRVNYRGFLMPTQNIVNGEWREERTVFSQSFMGELDNNIAVPAKMGVSTVVAGFATALQYMHEGDVWWIYIPSELGYGSQSSGLVLSYSTLTFYTNLVAIYRAGEDIPDWK